MNYLDLCSGAGGFHLAAENAGIEIYKTFYADINEYANKIYKARFPTAVALGDVRNIHKHDFADDSQWIITAGFPCQPFSVAGSGKGIDDDRYLWDEILRITVEFRADWFIFENVTGIEPVPFSKSETRLEMRRNQRTERFDDFEAIYARQEELQLAKCCQDLEDAGASFQVFDIPAISLNAWHRRRRIWIVGSFADFNDKRRFGWSEFLKNDRERFIRAGFGNNQSFSESAISSSGNSTDSTFNEAGMFTKNGFSQQTKCCRNDSRNNSDHHDQGEFQPQRTIGKVGRRIGNGHSGNTSDIDGERSEKYIGRHQLSEAGGEVSSGRNFSRRVWNRQWVEVAAELCRSDDGLRERLDIARLRHDLERSYPALTEADFERAIEKLESEYRIKRIELMGNSIVPQVAAEFFKIIKKLGEKRWIR